jgi:outer membrane lipoprotein carrier protein
MYRSVLLSCLLFAAPLAAEEANLAPPGSAREQLNHFSSGLETLRARFEQKVISSDGAVEDSSAGQVWLSRPQRFRWEYGGEFPEVVVADGERVWIYDVTLEQVTVKDQSTAAADSPLVLLTEPTRLDEQFEVREAGDASGLQLLELRSRSMEAGFDRILLGLRNSSLVLMIMEDAFGLRTELRFEEIQRNPVLDEGLFMFEPPAGVDLLGDLQVGKDGP